VRDRFDAASATVRPVMQVMDLQQETLARSLGQGHRVIRGVSGSGKTTILTWRAEHLANASPGGKPILVLCYHEPLAVTLATGMRSKGLADRVSVFNFHRWCRQQLLRSHQTLPYLGEQKFDELVERVVRAVERKEIAAAQYAAVLIDEAHCFPPGWLWLAAQMVDPSTSELLLLYDDVRHLQELDADDRFSLERIGIQPRGRESVLKINYRNTRQILEIASLIAADLLKSRVRPGGRPPPRSPVSCGRVGDLPVVARVADLAGEAREAAELAHAAHERGHRWGDIAVLCRRHSEMHECSLALRQRKLPHEVRKKTGTFNPAADTVKVMTMHASSGLEFPVVALIGVGSMPEHGADELEEARLFYVASTRATESLAIFLSGSGSFGSVLLRGSAC
jgi:hypothetical protein